MKRIVWMNLQMFADGENAGAAEAAPAVPEGGGAEIQAAGTGSAIRAGDTLADGRQVQGAQVAAELNRQMRKHPELRKVYGQRPAAAQQQAQSPEQAEAQPAEKTIQERWDELIKGEFKEMYGQGVQNAIKDRFKNQQDATKQLEAQNEVLAMAMKDRGVNSLDELKKSYQTTDPQIEAEAEKAGMTTESYLSLRALEQEIKRRDERDRQAMEEQANINHYRGLLQQAEELKKAVPEFDLQEELKDPEFFRLTSPEVGVSVEKAFYLKHGKEIAAASMKAGMERAQKQMGQTIRAQGMRPVEGAAHGQGQPAVKAAFDFNQMTPQERKKFRSQVLAGKVVIPGS